MNDYRIASLARRQISDIFRYIARDNLPAAERWISRLYDQFSLLASNPQMGEHRPDLAEGFAQDFERELRRLLSAKTAVPRNRASRARRT